jgi:hypothetical protein
MHKQSAGMMYYAPPKYSLKNLSNKELARFFIASISKFGY